MNWLNLTAPHGTAWELLVAVIVVIAGPILVERVRIPGLIGLLAGGCIIGPNVLGIASGETGVLHSLGEVGLLYLMFCAGLELDFRVFTKYRKQAGGFTALTFFLPQFLGMGAGFIVGYGLAASILLGSLFASFTLVVYPLVRNMGLASNGAVATVVGATVLTDTMALVVLAAVASSTNGDASGLELVSQIVGGIAILAASCFVLLPIIAKWFFHTIGTQRTLRYAFILAALLGAATLAEVVGIEGIVGAFFAGLALNRMVPNESDFMEKIEFFGSALLIPLFLVSVGTVIDPKVLVNPSTLGVAAVFVVACIGGKLLAAVLCKPLFDFTTAEVGVVFGLSVAQAAATFVGVVRPVYVVADGAPAPDEAYRTAVEEVVGRLGIDAELDVRHDRSVNDGVLHSASSFDASLLVVSAATQAWLPTLFGASQHGLVSASSVPTALVRAGTSHPNRALLVLSSAQAKRPTSAARLAADLADRLRASGLPLLVVASGEIDVVLTTALTSGGTAPEVITDGDWLEANVAATDVVVMPGGRNGALSTARLTKMIAPHGSTIAIAADRESVSTVDLAAERMGLLTTVAEPVV